MARMTGALAVALAGASFLCGNAQKEAMGPLVTYFLVLEGLGCQSATCLVKILVESVYFMVEYPEALHTDVSEGTDISQ